MTSKFHVEHATEEHVHAFAPFMREEDRLEILYAGVEDPVDALLQSVRSSTSPKAAMWDGEVMALFGVTPVDALNGIGCVWMTSGELVNEKPMSFLRRCRQEFEALLGEWEGVFNFIPANGDPRYERAIRWAKWLGFQVSGAVPFGKEGLPFYRISLWRS